MTRLAKLRTRAFFTQQCRCIYCSLPIWEPPYRERFARAFSLPDSVMEHLRCTAEHLVAKQDGGCDSPMNIAAACEWCKKKRHLHRPHDAPDPVIYQQEVINAMLAKRWHPAARWVERAQKEARTMAG